MAMAVRRRKQRAAKRNAARAARNALARDAAADIAENKPKRRYARTKTVLERLEARGAISQQQKRAGDRLARDYQMSNTMIGRLVGRYEANMPRAPKKYQVTPDTPRSCAAREAYDQAMAALSSVSPWLSGIAMHVVVLDQVASSWGALNGRASTDGVPILIVALDCLAAHYAGERRRAG